MRTLAVVPARAGSKGVPGKNRRPFMGKPLALWAIECGLRTCDRTVMTSDDPQLLDLVGYRKDVEIIVRPADLATDDTPMLDVLRHVLAMQGRGMEPDIVVLLQPTQPLRTDAQVRRALCLLQTRRGVDSVVSVVQIPAHQSPDFAELIENDLLRPFAARRPPCRQDCRPAYYRDGTVYAMKAEILNRGQLYGRALPLVIPEGQTCNIDTEADWKLAERLWRRLHAGERACA